MGTTEKYSVYGVNAKGQLCYMSRPDYEVQCIFELYGRIYFAY